MAEPVSARQRAAEREHVRAVQARRRRLRERLRLALHPECGWRERWRRVRRRVAWAVALLTIASLPLLVFALVGLPHVFRAPLVRSVRADGAAQEPEPGAREFASTFALQTGTALLDGNDVEALFDGVATFPRLWDDMRRAARSITVQMYYAASGTVADTAVALMARRARTGVAVYFLYDAFGAQDLAERYLDTLRAAGVHVAEFRPLRWYALDRASHRSHVRGVVIDGEVAYTGGFGLDDKWLGRGRRLREWRETNARLRGPAALQLQSAFIAKWAEATGELLASERLLPSLPTVAASPAAAALLYSPPVTGSTTAERLLALSIASARQRLYITNSYFVPQPDFVRLLVDAARRGVDVRILTNGARSDVRSTWLAGRCRYEPLLRAGVRLYEYRPTTVHAKTLVVDGRWSAITSMNFDNRSLAYNNEVALVTADRAVAEALESRFLADIQLADRIDLTTFARRGWRMRLLERGARVLARFL